MDRLIWSIRKLSDFVEQIKSIYFATDEDTSIEETVEE